VRTPRNDRPGSAIFRGQSEKQTHARVEFFDFSRLVPTPTPAAAATADKYFTGDAVVAGSDNNNYTCKAQYASSETVSPTDAARHLRTTLAHNAA